MSKLSGPFYGLDNLDERLVEYLPYENGTFVELGAFDGINQNNTYWLERHRHWRGILIEPVPAVYSRCVENRPLATVVNCACVSSTYRWPDIEIVYSGLMTIVRGARGSEAADEAWIARGEQVQQLQRYAARVPARTLASVLIEHSCQRVDLLSLDVEGYELDVLNGLDLTRFRPQNILVEESGPKGIPEFLASHEYHPVVRLSERQFTSDVLYRPREFAPRRRRRGWPFAGW